MSLFFSAALLLGLMTAFGVVHSRVCSVRGGESFRQGNWAIQLLFGIGNPAAEGGITGLSRNGARSKDRERVGVEMIDHAQVRSRLKR